VFLAAVPVDLVLHDTYYVVGHFHYVVMGAIGFAAFAGIYYWFPIVTGRMYQTTLGKAHFWLSMIGTNITFFAMILLGYGGMPRRYATYDAISVGGIQSYFTDLHLLATVGAVLLLVGQIIFVWNLANSWFEGKRLESEDPWGLKDDGMWTREWDWFMQRRETRIATDGGDEEVRADGGSDE
jgi:cytochrome c oxidase subunit 1